MKDDAQLHLELTQLAVEIESKFDAHMVQERDKRGKADHTDWNWASQIGHPCERNLCYHRLNWRDQRPKPAETLFRFDEGNYQERKVLELFNSIGIPLLLQQESLRWDAYKIKGRIDGEVPDYAFNNGQSWPVEIKTVSPWYWDTTRTVEEIKHHAKFWIRSIIVQLNTYLLQKEKPGGFLILKTFGKKPRIIPMLIDYELGEETIKKIERVNGAVKLGQLLPRISYDNTVCEMCDFNHLCQPVKTTPMVEVPTDMEADLVRYCDIKEQVLPEFKALEKQLLGNKAKPGFFRGKDAVLGDIHITTKEGFTSVYKVPKDIKEEYKEKVPTVTTKIERVVI